MAQRIRIRLKAYDHKLLDQSAAEIIDTVIRTTPPRASTGSKKEKPLRA